MPKSFLINYVCKWPEIFSSRNNWGLDELSIEISLFDDKGWHSTFLDMANTLGNRSHCVSKGVACFVTRENRIISTGINGTPSGLTNCDDVFCRNDFDKELHHSFSQKYEIHAEVNALLSAARNGISTNKASIYVNYSPCRDCAKSIIAAGIENLYFKQFYWTDLSGLILLLLSGKLNLFRVVEDGNSGNVIKTADDDSKRLMEEILASVNPKRAFWVRK